MRPVATPEDFRRAVDAQIDRELAEEAAVATRLRNRVLPLLRDAVREARTAGMCGDVWLFGSYAWGAPREDSDVDLLVDDLRVTPEALAEFVSQRIDLWGVDVVRSRTSLVELAERARSEGVAL